MITYSYQFPDGHQSAKKYTRRKNCIAMAREEYKELHPEDKGKTITISVYTMDDRHPLASMGDHKITL